jgi:hypothetical protein
MPLRRPGHTMSAAMKASSRTWQAFRVQLAGAWGMVIHIGLTIVMAGWALILRLPGDTFSTAKGYGWFSHHWPYTGNGWSYMFGAAAAVGAVGIVCRCRWWQLLSMTVLGFAQGGLALVIWEANEVSTATVAYAVFAWFALVRIVVYDVVEVRKESSTHAPR